MSNTVKLPNCPKCGAPIPPAAPQGLCPKCVLLGAATATEHGVPATATTEIPSIERIAVAFPQLAILELIGRGGMGFVFKARQPHLDRFVALKLLPDKLAKDAQFAERFNREGRVLAKLNHPNIVSVFDFGQTGGFYYLLMEYVDGVNLRQAMRAGRFSPGEALSIVPKVCEALQYAHEQGVLHRDIKPENILLDAKGRVKIADFGIAKLVGEDQPSVTLTNTGAALGTPHYMAPEQLEKPSTVDHRADIYSLGVVFYEMLTGELPIGRFAPPSSKTPVGANVDEIVFRTLEKEPGRRFQSAGEMQTRVQNVADEAGAPAGCGPATRTGAEVGPHGTVVLGDGSPVERPAKALLATGILNWIGSIAVVCLLAFTELGQKWPLAPTELGVVAVLMFVLSSLIITAAWKMRRLESYPLAVLGSVLAMITSPGSIIGLPIGLWALLTLRQPKVRAAFKSGHGGAAQFPVSRWAIYGALGVGLSLPVPLMMIVSILTGRSGLGLGELWPALGSVMLPGLGGTLLGWLGLNEIRESGGRVRGLPLAMFATLTWPLCILGGLLVGLPMSLFMPAGEPSASRTLGRILMLVLPAGVVTFAFGAIHATGRWATRRPASRERGVLKWVFIGILVAGIGAVLITGRHYESRAAIASAEKAAATAKAAIEAAPMIQFTFTSVELREEQGARWLSMDYVEQVRGNCQRTFRYDARVPGFTAQTRMDAYMSDAKAGFAPVLHQRVMWKLPDTLPHGDALSLRDLVAKEWLRKSAAIEPGDERVLFKVLVPDGGTLATAIGVRFQKSGTGTQQESAIGSAKLIGAGEYRNFAIARLMSVAGHPLHQLIARFAGPEIPQTSRAALSGPLLVPSPDEDVNTPAEPVDASILWGTNRVPVASALSFECPGDYSLQFVLSDENLARDAARQMNQALAQPISLVPGRQVPLFTSGNWKGWLEVRPFKPEPNRLAFFRHPGRSPAQIPGTNSIESAVATIPPGHELKVTGRLAVNGVSQPEPVFTTTLTSGPNEPGIYWFTWYLLPNVQRMDMGPKENWQLQIHDAAGRELVRSQAPERMNVLWRKKWVGDEPISVRVGKPIREIFFEKAHIPGDRSPTFVLLEMTMQRSVPASPDP